MRSSSAEPTDTVADLFLGTIIHHNVGPLFDAIMEITDPDSQELVSMIAEIVEKYT